MHLFLAYINMLYFLIFLFGAIFGSFANVVVFRYGEKSVVWPRSACPHCGQIIAWYDNVPIMSWLVLKAKCRHCNASISWQYPLFELFSGIIACLFVYRFNISVLAALNYCALMLLAIIALIDLRRYFIALVPVFLLLALSLAAGIYHSLQWQHVYSLQSVLESSGFWLFPKLTGLLAGFVSMAAILVIFTYFARKTGRIGHDQLAMGWGDPILLACIGFLYGWRVLPWLVAAGCLQGVVLFMLFKHFFQSTQKADENNDDLPAQSVPLGSFLCLGAIELVIFWPELGL